MGWSEKQACPHCAWKGLTRQQFYAVAVVLAYVAAMLIVTVFDLDVWPKENSVGAWVMVVGANVWFYLLPGWLLRRNTCPSCKQRFPIGASKADA